MLHTIYKKNFESSYFWFPENSGLLQVALGFSFASLIGEVKFWVRNPLAVGDPKHRMPLVFASGPLETV